MNPASRLKAPELYPLQRSLIWPTHRDFPQVLLSPLHTIPGRIMASRFLAAMGISCQTQWSWKSRPRFFLSSAMHLQTKPLRQAHLFPAIRASAQLTSIGWPVPFHVLNACALWLIAPTEPPVPLLRNCSAVPEQKPNL